MTEQEQHVHRIVTQILAERVVQKLLERQKQALVVYTGSNMGIEPGLECLRTLRREDGFTYRQSTSSPPYSVQFMAMPKGVTNSGAAGFTTGVPRYFSKTSSN